MSAKKKKKKPIPKSSPEVLKQVKKACKNFTKEETLGKLPLAAAALHTRLLNHAPHAIDLAGRGRALQDAIGISLHKMKVVDRYSLEGETYLCLYCHIYEKDPYTNRQIESVHSYLHTAYQLPPATYFDRLKKRGFPLLSYHLSAYLAQHAWIEAIPEVKDFVGRETELKRYRKMLQKEGLVVIEGVGGIGKTTLAAKLAQAVSAKRAVCWFTVRVGLNDTAKSLLYAWAAFLAQHDYPQLWAFMQATASKKINLTDFYPLLRKGLAKVRPLFCVDNLEGIATDKKEVCSLLSLVQDDKNSGLLLISQQRPLLPRLGDYPLLSGLSVPEVEQFMAQRQVSLTPEQLTTMRAYTLGNPRLLELWLTHLRLAKFDLVQSLHTLHDSQATADFLATEIVSGLSISQQQAAHFLSLSRQPVDAFLLQHPSSHLPPLSELDINTDDLSTLQQIGVIHHASQQHYTLSPLLRAYFLTHSSLTDTSDWHEWLALFYKAQGNVLEAAYHAIQAEGIERAVLWLKEQQHLLIEQGRAEAIHILLGTIEADGLNAPMRQLFYTLNVSILQILGEYGAAEIEANKAVRDATTIVSQAQAQRMQGELAKRRGKIWQAANHYEDALRMLSITQTNIETWLYRDLAWVLMQQNELDSAWNEAERAQIALENIFGTIARRRGEYDLAIKHLQQAVKYGEERGEKQELMRVYNNLGMLYMEKARFKDALTTFQANLEQVEQIGELVGQAITHLNIGWCYSNLDQIQIAIKHLSESLSIFTTLGDNRGKLLANLNLAEQYLRLEDLQCAQQHAKTAVGIDRIFVAPGDYAEASRIYAEVLLKQGNFADALATAQQALDELRTSAIIDDTLPTFNEPYYAQLACKTLADVHDALNEATQAKKCRSWAEQLAEKMRRERADEESIE